MAAGLGQNAPQIPDQRLARLLAAAARAHSAGQFARADAQYREILRHYPDNPDALHLLGLIALQTGQNAAAAELIGRAILGRNDEAEFYINRCQAYRALGRLEDALADGRKALAYAPADPGALYALGIVLLERGETEEAAERLSQAVAAEPGFAEARNSLAVALIHLRRIDEAVAHLKSAIEAEPGFAEAHGNLASALAQQGELAAAEASYRRALELDPQQPASLYNYGQLLRALGRRPEAAERLDRALQIERESPEIALALAQVLVELEAHDDAAPLLEKLAAVRPQDPEVLNWTGACRQAQGRFEAARDCFERAIALRPDYAAPHLHLALLNERAPDARELRRLNGLLRRADLHPWDRTALLFTLARLHERAGRYDDAFEHYRRANESAGGAARFDPEERRAHFARLEQCFDARLFADKAGLGSDSELPVFIVGMPRSGTTLVEQILASHPAVFGAGELMDMGYAVQMLAAEIGAAHAYPECAAALDEASAGQLAARHLERLRALGGPARRVTDKLPDNFQRVGFIHLLFPRARIVHCRRDPLDTCLSCYFQNFAVGQTFSCDLGNLGLFYRMYADLMAHWHRALPGRILDVRYESLVGDLESEARRIVAHCGLDWDPRCLAFHETERTIKTSSYWQVRQPLYASSVGRWRRYEKHLAPLRSALGL